MRSDLAVIGTAPAKSLPNCSLKSLKYVNALS